MESRRRVVAGAQNKTLQQVGGGVKSKTLRELEEQRRVKSAGKEE